MPQLTLSEKHSLRERIAALFPVTANSAAIFGYKGL